MENNEQDIREIKKLLSTIQKAFYAQEIIGSIEESSKKFKNEMRRANNFFYATYYAAFDSLIVNLGKAFINNEQSITIFDFLNKHKDNNIVKVYLKWTLENDYKSYIHSLAGIRDKFAVHIDKDQDLLVKKYSLNRKKTESLINKTMKMLYDFALEQYGVGFRVSWNSFSISLENLLENTKPTIC